MSQQCLDPLLLISKVLIILKSQASSQSLEQRGKNLISCSFTAYLKMYQIYPSCASISTGYGRIINFVLVFNLQTAKIRGRSPIFTWWFRGKKNKRKKGETLRIFFFCFLPSCPAYLWQNQAAMSAMLPAASAWIQPWFCIRMPGHLQKQLEPRMKETPHRCLTIPVGSLCSYLSACLVLWTNTSVSWELVFHLKHQLLESC